MGGECGNVSDVPPCISSLSTSGGVATSSPSTSAGASPLLSPAVLAPRSFTSPSPLSRRLPPAASLDVLERRLPPLQRRAGGRSGETGSGDAEPETCSKEDVE